MLHVAMTLQQIQFHKTFLRDLYKVEQILILQMYWIALDMRICTPFLHGLSFVAI